MTKVTTSRQLAEIAGVSHMTVSRAFRNDPKIREDTRQRILALAEEHDYRPNPVVALAMQAKRGNQVRGVTGTLGFVHSNNTENSWREIPHLAPYLTGVRERAREMGFVIDEFWMGRGSKLSGKRLSTILYSRGITGLIIAPPPGFVKHLRLDWDKFSAVTFHHDSWRPLLHRIATDDLHGMSVVLRKLQKLGYQRPGLALAKNMDASSNYASQGRFLVAQQQWKRVNQISPLIYRGPEIQDSRAEFLGWLEKHRPDCVICVDIGTRELILGTGRKIPEDIGLVHLNIGPDVADWSGYWINMKGIGSASVDLAVNRMARNERGVPDDSREVLIRGKWQAGATTCRQINC